MYTYPHVHRYTYTHIQYMCKLYTNTCNYTQIYIRILYIYSHIHIYTYTHLEHTSIYTFTHLCKYIHKAINTPLSHNKFYEFC